LTRWLRPDFKWTKAGAIEKIFLDELHGLRIAVKGHKGKWPISTVKFAE
jgi:hypothetical protein